MVDCCIININKTCWEWNVVDYNFKPSLQMYACLCCLKSGGEQFRIIYVRDPTSLKNFPTCGFVEKG